MNRIIERLNSTGPTPALRLGGKGIEDMNNVHKAIQYFKDPSTFTWAHEGYFRVRDGEIVEPTNDANWSEEKWLQSNVQTFTELMTVKSPVVLAEHFKFPDKSNKLIPASYGHNPNVKWLELQNFDNIQSFDVGGLFPNLRALHLGLDVAVTNIPEGCEVTRDNSD